MPEGADSFNATGPTVVAFETTSADTPVLQQFGVSVVGTACGVYGQGTSGPQKDRRSSPSGTGVYGRGDTQGVFGISLSVEDNNTPDFGTEPLSEAFGVVGVSGSERGDAPAVLGDNNVLKSELGGSFPRVSNAVRTEGANLPVGVEGVSWSGSGVYGISLNLNPDKTADLPLDAAVAATAGGTIPDAIDPDPHNHTASAGVLGLSMRGAGLRGASRFDRGGIFQSATARIEQSAPFPGGPIARPQEQVVAQIRLVPHRVYDITPETRNPHLPINGQTGDLLAVVSPDPNQRFQTSTLWFCERGRTSTGPAVWRKVALADTVIGT
jgi:hypothetical protein